MTRRPAKTPARYEARGPPPGDRDRDRERLLTEEVLYLHSLWHRGPPGGPAPLAAGNQRKRKRRRVESVDDETPEDGAGSEWPLAPSPPASPAVASWPEASTSASPTPAQEPSPGSLAQRSALRAAEEFFAGHASDEDDEDGSGSEGEDGGEEEEAVGFFMGLFERDAALRGYYERSWEDGEFTCLGCAGRKVRKGKARRFRNCVGLMQHAHASTRCGRPQAHRALASTVCRVLGWDVDRLPSIVIDPRGTLSEALAAKGTAAATTQEKDGGLGKNGSLNDELKDVDNEKNETSLNDGDAAKKDVDTGRNESSLSDGGGAKEDVDTEKNEISLTDGDAAMEDVATGKKEISLSDRDVAKEDVDTEKKEISLSDGDVAKGDIDSEKNEISLSDMDAAKKDVDTEKNEISLTDGDAAKEDVDTEKKEISLSDGDVAKEDVNTEKNEISSSVGDAAKEDVNTEKNENPLSDGDAAKEDVHSGKSTSTDNDEAVQKQETGMGSAEKEDTMDIDLLASKDTSKEEPCKIVQEEEVATVNKRDHANNAAGTGENDVSNLGNNSVDSSKL